MKNNHAFTVTEIIIAMAVLFIGVLGMFALFPSALTMAERSKVTTQMAIVGQSIMDEVIAVGNHDFSNLESNIGTNIADLDHLILGDPELLSYFENTSITIEVAPGHVSDEARNPINNNPILLKIDVEVHYDPKADGISTNDRIELFRTYIAKKGH